MIRCRCHGSTCSLSHDALSATHSATPQMSICHKPVTYTQWTDHPHTHWQTFTVQVDAPVKHFFLLSIMYRVNSDMVTITAGLLRYLPQDYRGNYWFSAISRQKKLSENNQMIKIFGYVYHLINCWNLHCIRKVAGHNNSEVAIKCTMNIGLLLMCSCVHSGDGNKWCGNREWIATNYRVTRAHICQSLY